MEGVIDDPVMAQFAPQSAVVQQMLRGGVPPHSWAN